MTLIKTKRVYQEPESTDGYRVLVDKFWPRGEKKEEVPYDLWSKDLAPSDSLRQWFHKDPGAHWNEFRERYKQELMDSAELKDFVEKIKDKKTVTLLFASKDTNDNNAVILKEYLDGVVNK